MRDQVLPLLGSQTDHLQRQLEALREEQAQAAKASAESIAALEQEVADQKAELRALSQEKETAVEKCAAEVKHREEEAQKFRVKYSALEVECSRCGSPGTAMKSSFETPTRSCGRWRIATS